MEGYERYVKVNGEQICVSEEVYREIRAQNNHARWKMRCEHRCAQAVYAHCDGDCQRCRYQVTGSIASLDAFNTDKLSILSSGIDIEAEFIRAETWRMVYHCADQVAKDGAAILKLYIEYDLSLAQISTELGIPKTTVHLRIMTILERLRVSFKNFF